MMSGVVIYNIVMNKLFEILLHQKETNHFVQLSKWLTVLFSQNKSQLDKDLLKKVEDFFEFYWRNSKKNTL